MARIFRSNRSQAVRLPKGAEFPEEVRDVDVLVDGEKRVLVPKGARWADYFASRISLHDELSADIPDQPAEPVEPFE